MKKNSLNINFFKCAHAQTCQQLYCMKQRIVTENNVLFGMNEDTRQINENKTEKLYITERTSVWRLERANEKKRSNE